MLEYAAVFLLDLYHRKVLNHGEKHWPILPIVIYTGSSPWTAPLACSGHRVPTFSSLLRFQPEMEYFLLDIPRIAKESLADEKNLSALLFRLEQCKSLDEVQAEVRKAKIRLKGEHYEEFRLILADWLWNTVITKFTTENPIKKDLDLEEVDTMLDETMEKIRDNMLRIREKDIEDAKSEGKIEKSKEIAKKMLDLNEALEKIIQLTDLSKQDILALKSEKAKA
ncbi:MAG: Rpn family recombination-promoting nuclease/putative transposase [Desulfovibrionaceae bacterium]|nr:Rpn family recombination-promoting nuclease/putative transposase [Desulfovibrionaceae bacterium]